MLGWIAKTWGFDTATENETPASDCQIKYPLQVPQQYRTHRTLDDIVIEGDSRFVNHVNRCIAELRNTKYESLVALLKKVRQVSTYEESGVCDGVYKCGPTNMGFGYGDCVYGASDLIHEAVHTGRILSGEFDYTDIAGEELIAFRSQIEFLRSRSRHEEANILEKKDGRHNEPYLSAETLAMQRR